MRVPAFTVLCTLILMGGVACSSEGESPSACASPTATTDVTMTDFAYAPECMEASAGDTLTLVNSGETPHTFTIVDASLDVDVAAGATGELTLDGVASGTTYEITCTYHPQMVATLRIA